MGGHKEGELASAEIVRALEKIKLAKTLGATVKQVFQRLHRVNKMLIDYAEHNNGHDVVGSTLAVLLVHNKHCVTIWSGDSRVYLFRRGELKLITRDHNNENQLLNAGVSLAEIKENPYAQTLTHAIGGEPNVFLDAQIQEIKANDVFLLCSDGLNKEVTDDEVEKALRTVPFQQVVDYLIDLALSRGGRDNISIIVVKCLSE